MGRRPCCAKEGLNRGAWSAREDLILSEYIRNHGEGKWRDLPKRAGLKRCGKSCRLRWLNYLRPDIKRGNISEDEESLIIKLHALLGNRWSLIAGRLPGRTDNEIKNYWNTNLSKKTNAPPQLTSNLTSKRWGMGELGPADSKAEPSAAGGERPSYVVRAKAVRCTKVYIPSAPLPPPSTPATVPANEGCDTSPSTASELAWDVAGEIPVGGFQVEDFDVEEFMIGFDEDEVDILQQHGGSGAHEVDGDSIWLCDPIMQQDQLGTSCGDSCYSASRLAAEVQTLASLIGSAEQVHQN